MTTPHDLIFKDEIESLAIRIIIILKDLPWEENAEWTNHLLGKFGLKIYLDSSDQVSLYGELASYDIQYQKNSQESILRLYCDTLWSHLDPMAHNNIFETITMNKQTFKGEEDLVKLLEELESQLHNFIAYYCRCQHKLLDKQNAELRVAENNIANLKTELVKTKRELEETKQDLEETKLNHEEAKEEVWRTRNHISPLSTLLMQLKRTNLEV